MTIFHKVVLVKGLDEIVKVEPPYIFIQGPGELIKIHCDKPCEPGWYWDGEVHPPEYLISLNLIVEQEPLPSLQLKEIRDQVKELNNLSRDFRVISSSAWRPDDTEEVKKVTAFHLPTNSYLQLSQTRHIDWIGYVYSGVSVKQVFKSYELKEVYRGPL